MTKPIHTLQAVKRKQLLHQTAQEEIKAYIVGNTLKPGDPLPPEAELAQQLNISRNSVREAVKALEAVGILEARAGAGLFVRAFSFDAILENLAYGIQFDLKQLSDILEVRHRIEYGMVDRVVAVVTDDQVQRLESVLDRMREVAEQGRYVADYDQQFHQLLYENVDNSVLSKILDVFWAIYSEAQASVAMPQPANPSDTYQRHVEIVAALKARDVAELQAAMAQHWHGIEGRVRMLDAAQQSQRQNGA
jgi:DNA-binding FadR family transcriptional regulator